MSLSKSRYSSVLFTILLIAEVSTIVGLNSFKAMPLASSANAQIAPDGTLPDNSIVTPNGETIDITGGTRRGTNLFHSFEEFSVNTGSTAFFDNASDIANIISRVTGGSISNIDGLIRANASADLFLINPNGIVFSENAALDIGGSFIGSTADSLKFEDGSEFDVVNSPENSLLTISIPVGLQYGQENGDITVNGSGNNLFIDFDTFTVDRFDRPEGLAVQPEKTLALVGSNIFLDGGNLTASGGNIELGGVAEGTVSLLSTDMGWELGYEEINSFQNINLSQAASIEASGNSGGRVMLQGGFVSLVDGSAILADTLGDGTGGSLTIAADEIEIDGAADNGFTSSLFTNVDLGATGDGGDLLIDTGSLYVGGGAQVNVNTFGLGNAGTLTVKASEIELFSVSEDEEFVSGLFAQADIEQTGTGGDINIETDLLLLDDSAEINAGTFGDGDAGTVTIQAQDIQLLGSFGFGSGLFASAESGSTGNGGSLEINTDRLYIAEGSQAIVATFGEGDGGNLLINANEIELTGATDDGFPSGLFTAAQTDSIGNAGDLQIRTNQLNISDSAQIAVSTSGSGNGGALDIVAQDINITGSNEFGPSSIVSNAFIDTGDAGEIAIATDNLALQDGATISASNFFSGEDDVPPGLGAAGNITIDANTIELDSIGDRFSSITSSTNAQAGGDIALNTRSLVLNNGSQITSESKGTGDGGSITLNSTSLTLNTGGFLSTSTNAEGDAGRINIKANRANFSNSSSGIFSEVQDDATGDGGSLNISANEFRITDQAQVSVNSIGLGQAGDVAIASDSLTLNNGNITATSIETGGGEISLATDFLLIDNNSLISTSVLDSTGGGGNIAINNSGFIIGQNNSDIKADAVFGNGGNIQITTQGLFLDASSQITASSEFGVDGVIDISELELNKRLNVVQLPQKTSTRKALIISNCPVPKANTFAVTGLGGIPENPSSYLRGRTLWQDARRLTDNADSNSLPNPTSSHSQQKKTSRSKSPIVSTNTIIESQAWIINRQGNVELVAAVTPKIGQQGIGCDDL